MTDILVIDDDIKIRELIVLMLEQEGYSVSQAENGIEAVEFCNKNNVDVIITDIIMPRKGGMRTILEVKNSFPKVGIIAMSGGGYLDSKEYLEYAKKIGANATLEKPFRKQELLSLVKELVN